MTRRRRPLAALALVAVIGAGCSKGPGHSESANTVRRDTPTDRDKAMQFAECMRDNGVRAFPDPDASGQLTIDAVANGSSVDTSTAAFEQAVSACRDLEPAGFTGDKRTAEQQQAGLRFAQCIRDNGVADFPDPDPNGPLVDTNRIPSAARPGGIGMLDAAMQKCHGAAAAAGVSPR